METYDPRLAPPPFGLRNTGSVCWLSSLLQAVVSATQVATTALRARPYLARTRTGRAFHDFVWAAAPAARPPGSAPFAPGAPVAQHSGRVRAALAADLGERRPGTRFGASQECAGEGLVHLLEMMDAPGGENPVSRLFYHRYECSVYCGACRRRASRVRDVAVQFSVFGPPPPAGALGRRLRRQLSRVEGYRCGLCGARGPAVRRYELKMAPEVVVVMFDLFRARPPRHFPERLSFPAAGGGSSSTSRSPRSSTRAPPRGATTRPGPGGPGARSAGSTTRPGPPGPWAPAPTSSSSSTPSSGAPPRAGGLFPKKRRAARRISAPPAGTRWRSGPCWARPSPSRRGRRASGRGRPSGRR